MWILNQTIVTYKIQTKYFAVIFINSPHFQCLRNNRTNILNIRIVFKHLGENTLQSVAKVSPNAFLPQAARLGLSCSHLQLLLVCVSL